MPGGGFGYAAAANDQVFGRVVFQPGALTTQVGGQAVKMPAAYRFAANAPRIAAAAIFLNPYVRAGVGIATWLGISKVVWDEVSKQWLGPTENSTVKYQYLSRSGAWLDDWDQACKSFRGDYFAWVERGVNGWCSWPGGGLAQGLETRQIEGTSTEMKPLTQEQMVNLLNPANQVGWPMPSTVPQELPQPTVLPVEQPVVNPAPGPNPAQQPQFVPTGNPVKNPNFDPSKAISPSNQPYIQPGVRIVPAPTPAQPWRVDMQPVNRPVASENPDETPNDENPEDKPQDAPSLCDKHPDIVACQKLGDIDAKPLEKKTVTLAINREEGFGPVNGSCPAPRDFVVMGQSFAFKWDFFCQFADGVRPIIVGVAYILAVMSFMGLSRKGD